ncbi:MAG: hypothetical protein LC798_21765 [Chloroflexi bacterium]|nr:hypothetical protein [Chloroflexota bacterium]
MSVTLPATLPLTLGSEAGPPDPSETRITVRAQSPITLTVGSRSLTAVTSDLSFSNVDPGGYEQLQATVRDTSGLNEGDEVTVRSGLDTAWHGRVNEIGALEGDGRSAARIAALGYGAKLTDKRMAEIYADRDLSHWEQPSTQRRIDLVTSNFSPRGTTVTPDDSTGAPSLAAEFQGPWDAVGLPIIEALYRAQGVAIGSLYYQFTKGANTDPAGTDVNFTWRAFLGTTDTFTTIDSSGELRLAASTGTLAATTGNRVFAGVYSGYSAGPAGDSRTYALYWKNLVVYGNHGLTAAGQPDVCRGARRHRGPGRSAGARRQAL